MNNNYQDIFLFIVELSDLINQKIENILTEIEYKDYIKLSDNKRADRLLGRLAIKKLIISYFNLSNIFLNYLDIEIINLESGKPIYTIKKYKLHKLHISISHNNNCAVASCVAVDKKIKGIGVDIQRKVNAKASLAGKIMSKEEYKYFLQNKRDIYFLLNVGLLKRHISRLVIKS